MKKIFKPNTYWFHNTRELCLIFEETKNNAGTIKCKHVSNDSEHFAYHGISCMDREATTEEITEALKNESIKRGFKEGVFIHRPFGKDLHDRFIDKNNFPEDMDFYYDSKEDYLEHYGFVIYSKGQWAKIIEPQTQKETDFNKVVEDTLSNIREKLISKGKEYRRENNPYHNFEVGARKKNISREKALDGMLLKHEISIEDLTNDLDLGILPTKEMVHEKFDDNINFLILKKAMFLDRIENQKTE